MCFGEDQNLSINKHLKESALRQLWWIFRYLNVTTNRLQIPKTTFLSRVHPLTVFLASWVKTINHMQLLICLLLPVTCYFWITLIRLHKIFFDYPDPTWTAVLQTRTRWFCIWQVYVSQEIIILAFANFHALFPNFTGLVI